MTARFGLLLLMLLMGLPTLAWARLGETQEQLEARYGKGTNAGSATVAYPVSTLIFHKENWNITVRLINGISVGESFQKQGGPTDEDIQTLLGLNSQGQKWKETQPRQTMFQSLVLRTVLRAWEREDGSYAFKPGPIPYCLTIQSKQLLDADAAKEAADKKAKESSLKGF